MPSSATTCGARSGRNTWCWSRCRARPRPCATPSGRSARNPLTREFLLDLAREVVAVGRAHGVNLPADYAEQRIPFFDGWPPEMTTSMHHDLQGGKPLEVRWLSGGVVELGQAGRRADADEPRRARHIDPPRGWRRGQAGTRGAVTLIELALASFRHYQKASLPAGRVAHAPASLNSLIAFVRPILRRSVSLISALSNHAAASPMSSNG